MELIIDFLKKAIAALLELLGIEADEKFADNVESAVKDVVDFGTEAAK
ncbi:MAG: hypothetical protein IJO73_01855 [Clostridia bacterium]|nr:hypothetical protein [Clostridia bacterium]